MVQAAGEVQRVADALLQRIVAGEYPAGLRLPSEAELSVAYACGRSTIREALRELTGMGVVKSKKGSGALVLDFRKEGTPALLPAYLTGGKFDVPPLVLAQELLHLRAHLAAEAVRVAAIYAEPKSLDGARKALEAASLVEDDPVEHTAREMDFFQVLVQASGIWPVVWFANVFWAPMRRLQTLIAPAAGPVPAGFQQAMGGVLDAVEARDPVLARERVVGWLSVVDESLLARTRVLFEGQSVASSDGGTGR